MGIVRSATLSLWVSISPYGKVKELAPVFSMASPVGIACDSLTSGLSMLFL